MVRVFVAGRWEFTKQLMRRKYPFRLPRSALFVCDQNRLETLVTYFL
ncbi:hypothetical protein M2271_006135 [Streptomyces sp. LBL]|nr:hypothetical protein [Streptomyces sp. LBL]